MTNTSGPPLEVIAASLRRERQRTGLSLTEVARRAGIARARGAPRAAGPGPPGGGRGGAWGGRGAGWA